MNNEQINNTSYYQLPCGKFLEDFIYFKKLNFNMGSALKYMWRAGNKDGESRAKDLAKANHYIMFEAKCRSQVMTMFGHPTLEDVVVKAEIDELMDEARKWAG